MKSLDAMQAFVDESEKIKKTDYLDPVVMRGGKFIDQLLESFSDALRKRNDRLVVKKRTYFTPNTNNMCSRYWAYMFNGVEYYDSFSPRTYRIFDNGHAVHERICSYLKEAGVLLQDEIQVTKDDPPIFGYADGIVMLSGERFVIEIKSILQEGFVWRETQNKPTDDHMRQIQLYMDALDIDKGFVIYENKNTQEILPIYVEKDEALLEKVYKKYRKILKEWEAVKNTDDPLPARPYKRSSKNCQQCSLKDVCWGESVEVGAEYVEEPF